MTLTEFIESAGLALTLARADSNPNMADPTMHHFTATIASAGADAPLVVPFSTGAAWTTDPTLADVLSCLAADAAGYHNAADFADWCSEYGYDDDSIKALETYNAVGRQYDAMHEFFGEDLMCKLMWECDPE